ncbi:MAG: ABC transporter permease [Pseudomonadota bacterium]
MSAPEFDLLSQDGRAVLTLRGDWVVTRLGAVDERLRDALGQHGASAAPIVAAGQLGRLDTAGAFLIDFALRTLSPAAPAFEAASPQAKALLVQARALATQEEHAPPEIEDGHGFVDMLERTGRGVMHLWEEMLDTLSFLGATAAAVGTVIVRPARMRWTALVAVMEESGLDAVPIVAFLCFFVGMVVAFIGATTLAEFGATIFVVELVGISVLREFGVILTAIILAGRTNSAFTAQIGSMKMRQEIDAMTTLGLDPMHVLVAPRVIAMVLVTPVLAFIGALTGLAGGVLVGWLALDISPVVFLNRFQEMVGVEQFWIGLVKAPVFGLVVALIGCRQGLEVGGSVQSLGTHTTKSVVQALFAIIVIDALFAILFMELGL